MAAESGPKVRDLTRRRRRLPIEVDGGSMYELLLVTWLAFDPSEEHAGFDLGADWFDRVANATPPDLRGELEYLGGARGDTWCALRGLVALAPPPHDIDPILDWMEGVEPEVIRRGLLDYQSPDADDASAVDRAVEGDPESMRTLVADHPQELEHLEELFSLEKGELRERLVTALRRFRSVYREFEEDFARATGRAAADTRPIVREADPERVIEDVTNGLDYRIPPGVTRLVLVPSVVLRPWAVIDRYRDVLMVAFAVADEYVAADPDAPPSWVVKVHKALGDEKRLRILRRLAEGPAALDDLAALLEVSKSTVHHHVGLLRGAGLVRVSVDTATGSKAYTIRPTVLPGAHEALGEYLNRDHSDPVARSER